MDTRRTTDVLYKNVVRVECPHCGHSNAIIVATEYGKGVQLVRCDDAGDGGCDKDFVVRYQLQAIVDAAPLPFDEP